MEKIIKEFQKPMLNKPNYLKLPNKPNVYEPVYNNNSNSNNKPVVGKKPGLKATLKISNNPLFEKNKKKPMNKINENPNEENKAVGKISTLESLKKVGANIRRINNAKKKLIGNTRPRSERRVDNKERLKELKKVVKKKNPRLSPSKINMEARKMLKKEKGT
jgi:hypothetical protein